MKKQNGFNAFGKVSSLRVVAGEAGGKTFLKELSFTAPFKVMSPFPLPGGGVRVMPLMASAGILEGDRQEIYLETEPDTRMDYVSQSYEKLHKMKNGNARRDTDIKVGKESVLLYRPLPVIPFGQSAFESHTSICLEDPTSSLFYQEILTCGRAERGELFEYRYYHSIVEARRSGRLVYRENNRFCPAKDDMAGTGMFEGYSCLANVLFFHAHASDYTEDIRSLLEGQEEICGGVTLTADGDAVVRILGKNTQKLWKVCDLIFDTVNKVYLPFSSIFL